MRPHRRVLIALLGVVVAATAVLLIVSGLRPTPSASAPLPAQDFNTTVPDPALPPLESLAAAAGEDDGTVAPDDHSRTDDRQAPETPVRDDHLVIPALGVDAAVTGHPLDSTGSLVLPSDVNRVTRWDGSAPIDSTAGTVLVAGHVDNADQGTGALYWIHTLQPGDVVYLAQDGVVTRWKVTGMESVRKALLPERVWAGPDGPRQLILVTCGGQLERDAQGRGNYLDNVVVTAVPF